MRIIDDAVIEFIEDARLLVEGSDGARQPEVNEALWLLAEAISRKHDVPVDVIREFAGRMLMEQYNMERGDAAVH